MDAQFEKLIEVNVSGRVFALCQSRKVVDPSIIGYYRDILLANVQEGLSENATTEEFNQLLEEQLVWLAGEIDQSQPAVDTESELSGQKEDAPVQSQRRPAKKKAPYVPKAMSMEERLAEQRVDMEKILLGDCVTLKLLTPKQAKEFKRRLLGKEPKQAEEELVAELRNILHQQIRAFIRKHEGGPWATAALQQELRMDIAATRSLRSLTSLARGLFNEREEWLEKCRSSITGRLFGGKLTLHK